VNSARDYDKEPLVIKDYGNLFKYIFQICVIWIIFFYKDISIIMNNTFVEILSNGALFSIKTIIIMPCTLIFIIVTYYFIEVKKTYKGLCYFKFTNTEIYYQSYNENYRSFKTFLKKNTNIDNVKKISFCVMSDLPRRYGRKMKAQPKKSTFSNALAFVYYLTIYVFSVLPYRVTRLIKNKESLKLLNKNIVIVFKNENYLLVNIYSKKDLDDLLLYFQEKNIEIDYKTKFLYQVQNIRPLFSNKYEDWNENFS